MGPLERNRSRLHSAAFAWLSRERLIAYSTAMLVIGVGFVALWAIVTHGFSETRGWRPGSDLIVFWSASHAVLHGQASTVFDYSAFSRIVAAATGGLPKSAFIPWLYPPTFLLFVAPLALLPLPIAYGFFLVASVSAFVCATVRVSGLAHGPLGIAAARYVVLAMPCVMVCAIFGQNALITAALAAFAVASTERRPVIAGICIGLLVIKPQLGILFPVVLIAARAWKVFGCAAVTAALFSLASVALCGTASLRQFAGNIAMARELILEHDVRFWLASPSVFASLRLLGASLIAAGLMHAAIGIIAACGAWKIWRTTRDCALRAAALATATLIVTPYVWHYELTWVGLSCAGLLASGLRRGWLAGEQPVLLLVWLLPIFEFINQILRLPQTGPVILLLMLLALLRRARIEPIL
ncbi:glycosyltransferase family 87 protein [Paraburkholderia sp. J10-1]|uniref:glycosyltransferase family 87 protein n=1 Tax=Paraburkholderia sp. J10-1 TaxID=2805430 RepID=UPI002AB76505|nr:glycosyltransferase family 87 protein [Paraburkholderia sp. J10-1]